MKGIYKEKVDEFYMKLEYNIFTDSKEPETFNQRR